MNMPTKPANMEAIINKLNENMAATPSRWEQKGLEMKKNREWLKTSRKIALTVLDCLAAMKMTQKQLAEKMGVSPQYINKIVKGRENLTLETLSALERALNFKIMSVCDYIHTQKIETTTYVRKDKLQNLPSCFKSMGSYESMNKYTTATGKVNIAL